MAHPAIDSFPETFFFTRGLGGRRGRVLGIQLRGLYQWWHLQRWRKEARTQGVELPWVWPHYSPKRMAKAFVQALDRVALSRGKTVWVEKTPSHLDAAERISELVPDARFVHIVRDGRAVVASLSEVTERHPEHWGSRRTVEQCVERWNRCVATSAELMTNPRHRIVEYGRLATQTEEVLRELCEFLAIPFAPAMLTDYADMASRVTSPSESWKAMNREPIRDQGLDKYHRLFDARQREEIERTLDWDTYRRLGFTPAPNV